MSRTRTLYIDLERLQASGDSASTIIRLMMACNDIALANQCLKKFKEDQTQIKKHVQRGALMYFVRLQCGHLNEALKIIQEIKDDKTLCNRMERCSQNAKESFKQVANCLKGGTEHKKFEEYVGKIRHKTVFHYDKKLVDRALTDRASREDANRSKITVGDDISLFRFELSDDIVNSIVCRQICKIPRSADLRPEIDNIMVWASDKGKYLLDFGGEFIYRYIEEYAAI